MPSLRLEKRPLPRAAFSEERRAPGSSSPGPARGQPIPQRAVADAEREVGPHPPCAPTEPAPSFTSPGVGGPRALARGSPRSEGGERTGPSAQLEFNIFWSKRFIKSLRGRDKFISLGTG